jgi:hypothetical protein
MTHPRSIPNACILIVSLAVFVFSVGYLLRSIPRAEASPAGPEVTGGTHPYKSFSGTTGSTATTVYTVPADRIFVLTGACVNFLDIRQDSELKVKGSTTATYCSSSTGASAATGFLARGQGQIVFEPGTNLIIDSSSGTQNTPYVLQGYLAHP